LKIENHRGEKLKGMKIYAHDSSFERARRAESNDNKIDKIGIDLTKLWHKTKIGKSAT